MHDSPETFTLEEVTSRGFEARCLADGCVEYLWHLGNGLRVDPRDSSTMLITDPAALPRGPWTATELGARELRNPELLEPLG